MRARMGVGGVSCVLSIKQAEDLAARMLRYLALCSAPGASKRHDADRDRIASDLDGLCEHQPIMPGGDTCDRCDAEFCDWPCSDARRYSDNLRGTATLYGVES